MIYLQEFLVRFLKTSVTWMSLILVSCMPQGGKEERIKHSHGEEAHDHTEKPKDGDAVPLKDCEEEAGHEHELLLVEDHEHEEAKVENKVPAKKEDCKKKEATKEPEKHDDDHE